MTSDQLQQLIQAGESLDLEFKGEERAPLNDRAIFEQAVCFANSEGGTLLIGVEDDRRITGARPRHGNTTEPAKLQAAIFNNTEPRINSRVSVISINGLSIIAVEVDPYPEICATKSGTALRRVMAADGPQCVPFYPHEHVSRRVNLGLLDYTAQSPSDARWEDIDSQRRTSTEDATVLIQKPASEARRVLERLTERGWLEAKGEKKGRVYHFTPAIYDRLGQPEAYVRSKGISAARHEALVEEYVRAHRRVTRPAVPRSSFRCLLRQLPESHTRRLARTHHGTT